MTTWWDVYETLLHLLFDQEQIINNQNNNSSNLNNGNDYNLDNSEYYQDRLMNRKNVNQPNGHSLFFPIPNRNCKTANIPSYLCSCDLSVDIDINSDIIKQGVLFLVGYINDIILKDLKEFCMILTLDKIIVAQIFEKKNKYAVIFQAGPNNAIFDAQFTIDNYGYFQLYGKIIRINHYGNTANCINSYYLRNFCYCYDNNFAFSSFFNILKLFN